MYPLGQHASGSEAEVGDLPNLWPARVAFATWIAVSQPCLLLDAVRRRAIIQSDSMMRMVQLVRQADKWAHWMQAVDEVEDESVSGVLRWCTCLRVHSLAQHMQ